MAFFVGPLDDAGHIDYSKGHDVGFRILQPQQGLTDLLRLVSGPKDWKRWPEIRIRTLVMGGYASLRESLAFFGSVVRYRMLI